MTLDARKTLIGLLQGMQNASTWMPPSASKIEYLLAQLDAPSEKLVRNAPGHRIRADGLRVRVAAPAEMLVLLARKLVEEAQEVLDLAQDSHSSHHARVEELADVAEVASALRREIGASFEEFQDVRDIKLLREGAFDERLVWVRND